MYAFPGAANDKPYVTSTAIAIPPPGGQGTSVVYMLLPQTPIDQTIDIQYRFFLQPRSSFFHFQNILVFMWGDPPMSAGAKMDHSASRERRFVAV
jgi:hypothetical protein